MELRGKPTVTIVSEAFSLMATREVEALNMPDLPMVVVPHPIATRPDAELRRIAAGLVPSVLAALGVRDEVVLPSGGAKI